MVFKRNYEKQVAKKDGASKSAPMTLEQFMAFLENDRKKYKKA